MLTIRNHKFIALLLCFVMVATSVAQFLAPATVHAAENTALTILEWDPELEEGEPTEETFITKDTNTILKVEGATDDVQWQYYSAEHDMWISVYGETDEFCTLTYAKVCNILDKNDQTKVRCIQKNKDNTVVSNEVEFSVIPAPEATSYPMMRAAAPSSNEIATVAEEGEVVTPEKCNVIIEYVFEDGEQAANPWTSSVEYNTGIDQVINSPTVLGYTPDKATVDLSAQGNFTEETTTITVTYTPALVGYTVKHYQQNLNNDKYTLVATEDDKTAFTESAIRGDLAKEYEGFYALLYDTTATIAADGSTVVEIYYDRYYYLMNFDVNGGYGVEPIYARYGADVSAGTPTRAGYTFDGWKDVSTGTVYAVAAFPYKTMPAKNTEFEAQWTGQQVTYDVVFWYENADDDNYSQAGVLLDQTDTAGSIVNGSSYQNTSFTGKDATHFTYSHADQNVEVKGDGSTVVNVYFTRNVYTLTFEIDDTTSCDVEIHQHDDSCKTLSCSMTEHNHEEEGCSKSSECTHNNHTLSCYSGQYNAGLEATTKPDRTLTNLGNGIYSYTSYNGGTRYVLNIGDNWYRNEYGAQYGIYFNCTHNHTDDCYTCNEQGHIHVSTCYKMTCTQNEHYHSNGTCYLVVTKKYDADISNVWTSNPVAAVLNNGNAFEWDATDAQVSFLEKMPGQNSKMVEYGYSGSRTYHWYYYLEVLPGQDTTGKTTTTYGGKTYYQYDDRIIHYGNTLYLTYVDDYYPITGFKQLYGKTEGGWYKDGNSYRYDFDYNNTSKEYEAHLYYTRESYDLKFSNNGNIITNEGGTFMYQADISGEAEFEVPYPAGLEANAYVFDGWYTSPFGGTKYVFYTKDDSGNRINKATMPAKDLTLYARWVPVEHNVKLYPTYADMVANTSQIGDTEVVAHGSQAAEPADPTRGQYDFVGWFYMDGETEKAFDFSMPVNKDLNLYAKWSSNKLMEYTIHYELADGTTVAPDTTGSALAGTTKTFEAKAGDELNSGYKTGYFPNTNSHSLTIDIEDPTKNEFTFIYTPKEKLPYKVMYLEYDGNYEYDGTETVLHEEKIAETPNAIIAETFEPVTGYMPDAYQKRLVLSADTTQNVIIFWYVEDKEHAPVQIIHYIQNAVGDGYTVYQESTDLNGVINNPYSTNILTIYGYDYDHATANEVAVSAVDNKVTGTVTKSGLKLELYYHRELHPYEFRFLEQGTDKVLADPVNGTARYGAQVTQNSKTIPGYTCKDDAQAVTIQVEDGNTAVKNVRIFYYVEDEVTIDYKVVGPDGCGTVSTVSEKVKVFTDTAVGSVATPSSNAYKFVGWYEDEACTIPVDSTWVNENSITPDKTKDYDNGIIGKKMGYENKTYYAKFEHNLGSLTIKKDGISDVDHDDVDGALVSGEESQSTIFNITGPDGYKQQIVIHGNESATIENLFVGNYVITEEDKWSWRYGFKEAKTIDGTLIASEGDDVEVHVAGNATSTVVITNDRSNSKWLNGGAYNINQFKVKVTNDN